MIRQWRAEYINPGRQDLEALVTAQGWTGGIGCLTARLPLRDLTGHLQDVTISPAWAYHVLLQRLARALGLRDWPQPWRLSYGTTPLTAITWPASVFALTPFPVLRSLREGVPQPVLMTSTSCQEAPPLDLTP